VQQIYDRIQDEYNGQYDDRHDHRVSQYDDRHDHWANARRSFFTSDDIIALAREFGALQTPVTRGWFTRTMTRTRGRNVNIEVLDAPLPAGVLSGRCPA
jgi:hypothetical protein